MGYFILKIDWTLHAVSVSDFLPVRKASHVFSKEQSEKTLLCRITNCLQQLPSATVERSQNALSGCAGWNLGLTNVQQGTKIKTILKDFD